MEMCVLLYTSIGMNNTQMVCSWEVRPRKEKQDKSSLCVMAMPIPIKQFHVILGFSEFNIVIICLVQEL